MDQNSSEQEQIEKIKHWWEKNGKPLFLGLSAVLLSAGGFKYWDGLKDKEAKEASLNYEQMLVMISNQNFSDAQTTGQTIVDTYPKSIYAPLSRLLLAKSAVDENNLEKAKKLLTPLVEGAYDNKIKSIASSRLARIALAENNIPEAKVRFSALSKEKQDEEFSELRGDILVAEENFSAARLAYLTALANSENAHVKKEIIRLKLNNLPEDQESNGS